MINILFMHFIDVVIAWSLAGGTAKLVSNKAVLKKFKLGMCK
jgi:hypothetical protein